MYPRKPLALCVSLVFAAAFNAGAQAPSPSSSTSSPKLAANSPTDSTAAVSSSDRKFMTEAAQGGMVEVELGQLASQKASDPQVKQFADRMVADHSKANDKLKQIAASKNLALPTDIPAAEKREHDKLSKLSGAQFDHEYMSHMMTDHKKDVSEFKSASKSLKDPELKQFAADTLPVVEEHLQLAEGMKK